MPGVDPLPGETNDRDEIAPKVRSVLGRIGAPLAFAVLAFGAPPASAQNLAGIGGQLGTLEVIQLAMFVGVMGAALLSAIWLIRERARTAAENVDLRTRVAELGSALRRTEALLNLKDQRFVVWSPEDEKSSVLGELPDDSGAPGERAAFLAFGRWLMPGSASSLERSVTALRGAGTGFDIVVETRSGSLLEVQGRKAALHAVARFSALSEKQREYARLRLDHRQLSEAHEAVLGLLEALPAPFWLRDGDGGLAWVNDAFASAAGAGSREDAIEGHSEFLPTSVREEIARGQVAAPVYAETVSTVVDGDRRVFAVTDMRGVGAAAGIAIDISDIDALRREHESTMRSHADTLDQLTTAVAIFDENQKLRFFNHAFQKLWDLDLPFMESAPENALLLDRLRSEGKLAEQPEWRRWKEQILSTYRSLESSEHWWHLPDGRTIRVIANPQPRGGVTWVFENLTEQIDLESRYNTAVRVQGETLDNLAEGVAVFGPDGRLRLSNPAFQSLWGLPADLVQPHSHISTIRAACEAATGDGLWADFVAAVTGFDEERRDRHGRAELVNGSILSYAIINLPNGQVMMTFVDVTDSVNVERALKDKNDALQKADQLKNDFVQHVSYELRSPLTNIIGFTELLALSDTGPLNERQREYVDHVGSSSAVLLTIVNDILDLATVDAGIMQLDIGEVRVAPMIEAACELVDERLREHDISIRAELPDPAVVFRADENRVRQILFNLLTNASNYAPRGSTVVIGAARIGDMVEFSVHDDGPGIAPDVLETIFSRFEPHASGGRRRGAGLGLSVVKSFVELHGGTVEIETGENGGTTVICRFPLTPARMSEAAE